ncbi:MAG: deoxyribose-phosphate aldolase [Anaerolineae bacterium]|nr:deoxyribose-phosphate aldolase [Anaerolineae bacterium]
MFLTKLALAQMIDISAVKADSTAKEVESCVNAAMEHKFIAVFPLPTFAMYTKNLLKEQKGIILGGTVGFPSGSTTTNTKVFEAKELIGIGCQELDMVINIAKLKSKMLDEVSTDVSAVTKIAGDIPVKVILEVSLLSDEEIATGSRIIRDCGAKFIKTGTGWSGATTLEHIRVIKNSVGNSIDIKVAGGVRNLESLLKIHEMGVSRFGLGYKAAIDVMAEYDRTKVE